MANVKVKFLEPVRFEGSEYEKDEEYSLSDEKAKALGDSVKILGKGQENTDNVKPLNKMNQADLNKEAEKRGLTLDESFSNKKRVEAIEAHDKEAKGLNTPPVDKMVKGPVVGK